MPYTNARTSDKYRYKVRVSSPKGYVIDEYIVTTSREKAYKKAIAKYGEGHKALVLDQEPGSVFK